MLRATLIPIITPSYTANPWSTIFMNEPNLDVACGGGVNSLWVVVLMKSALSFIWLFTYEYGFLVKHPRYDEKESYLLPSSLVRISLVMKRAMG